MRLTGLFMAVRRLSVVAFVGSTGFLVSGCELPPAVNVPTQAELSFGRNADRPTDNASAQKAVMRYFRPELEDPDAANYQFLPLVNSYHITDDGLLRQFGWFMCGYIGDKRFIAYFDPYNGDVVKEKHAIIDPRSWGYLALADRWCDDIYQNPEAQIFEDTAPSESSPP